MDNRRTIIEATLSFGLINMPVSVTKAHGREVVKLRNLHAACGTPVQQRNICPSCDTTVEQTDLAKGFQVNKNRIVELDADELGKFTAGRSRTIELRKFVSAKQLDQVLVEKLYYLAPNEALHRPYDLLTATLKQTKTVAVGKASLWGRETPVAVWPQGHALTLALFFCADEVLPPIKIDKPVVNDDELEMAVFYVEKTIEKYGDKLEVSDLVSDSRARTMEYIEAVIAGATPETTAATGEPEPTFDVMQALKEMVR